MTEALFPTHEEKFVFNKQIDELTFPTTSSMVPPPSKIKTNGAPKKKKQKMYDVQHNPSYWEHVDEVVKNTQESETSNKLSQRASKKLSQQISQNTSKKLSQQISQGISRRLLPWVPLHFHSCAAEIIDVEGDENCGYRSVAISIGYGEESWLLIRQELILEITSRYDLYSELFRVQRLAEIKETLFVRNYGRQDADKWLSMPKMRYIISTKSNVALVELSLKNSYTYLPLRGSYSPRKNRSIISILHVNNIHWVHVALLLECPLPPIGLQCERFSSDEAMSWLDPYIGRFQLWVSLAPVSKPPSHPPKIVDLTADFESD